MNTATMTLDEEINEIQHELLMCDLDPALRNHLESELGRKIGLKCHCLSVQEPDAELTKVANELDRLTDMASEWHDSVMCNREGVLLFPGTETILWLKVRASELRLQIAQDELTEFRRNIAVRGDRQ